MVTRGGVGASGRQWSKWFCMRRSEVGVTGNSCRGVSGHSDMSELALSRSSNRWLRLPSCCCCTYAHTRCQCSQKCVHRLVTCHCLARVAAHAQCHPSAGITCFREQGTREYIL